MINKKVQTGSIILSIIIIAIIIGYFIYSLLYAFHSGSETITIKDKWVKQNRDSGKYLISSTDGQVFEITDSIIKGRFDSSNLYAELQPGQTCNIETQGWRFGFHSDYKNIIKAEC